MPRDEDTIQTRHPERGKTAPRIARWKYDAVRRALRRAVPRRSEGLAFKDLPGKVRDALSTDERRRLGSVSWYTVVVKLDLEARGEIERVPGARPQRIRRVR